MGLYSCILRMGMPMNMYEYAQGYYYGRVLFEATRAPKPQRMLGEILLVLVVFAWVSMPCVVSDIYVSICMYVTQIHIHAHIYAYTHVWTRLRLLIHTFTLAFTYIYMYTYACFTGHFCRGQGSLSFPRRQRMAFIFARQRVQLCTVSVEVSVR
jgi:hypothetical protein